MMKKHTENGFWNGEPATISACLVMIKASPETLLWHNAFAGTGRQAIEITQDGTTFAIDNEAGDGYTKVTKGKGSPQFGHRSLSNFTLIGYLDKADWNREFSKTFYDAEESVIKKYQQMVDPAEYAKLVALEDSLKKFQAMTPEQQVVHIRENMMKPSSPSRQFNSPLKKDGKGKR